jgi:hypothetical protein
MRAIERVRGKREEQREIKEKKGEVAMRGI